MDTGGQRDLFEPPFRCLAERYFGLEPAAVAVDPTGQSLDEADLYCPLHRGRVTEGVCVGCGRRLVWCVLTEEREAGVCRLCIVERWGEGEATLMEKAMEHMD